MGEHDSTGLKNNYEAKNSSGKKIFSAYWQGRELSACSPVDLEKSSVLF
jgi:hypothetical protein